MHHKILIVESCYPKFLEKFYLTYPDIIDADYAAHYSLLFDQHFGTADYFSYNLNLLGHDAETVLPDCTLLQRAWATEHGMSIQGQRSAQSKALSQSVVDLLNRAVMQVAPVINRNKYLHHFVQMARGHLRKVLVPRDPTYYSILREQIRHSKPDILYIHEINTMDASFLRECRSHVRFIVGQIASVILPTVDLRAYDLLISSFPHYVKRFREMGLSSEYLKIAFETRVLERLSASNKTYDNTFVGGLSRSHTDRINLLEHLSLLGLVDIWGYGVESLDSHSAIRSRYHSEAWGLEMYQLLANSRIALNQHINVAGRFANNQRLYEATGVGALLLTDEKDNLQELFVPGEEVITYGSIDDCREKIEYYIAHSDESTAIAQAGQKRTLSENTYYHRMQELSEILSKYMVKV